MYCVAATGTNAGMVLCRLPLKVGSDSPRQTHGPRFGVSDDLARHILRAKSEER